MEIVSRDFVIVTKYVCIVTKNWQRSNTGNHHSICFLYFGTFTTVFHVKLCIVRKVLIFSASIK